MSGRVQEEAGMMKWGVFPEKKSGVSMTEERKETAIARPNFFVKMNKFVNLIDY